MLHNIKKSILLTIISLFLLIFSLFLPLSDISRDWFIIIGIVSIFFKFIGIVLDYKDIEYRPSLWISFIPWNGRWLYIHSSWVLFIGLVFIPFYENLFGSSFFGDLNKGFVISFIVLWILSAFISIIAGILATPLSKLKMIGKRKKRECPNCGAKLSPGYDICMQCGEKILFED